MRKHLVLSEIGHERHRQDRKWGEQNHPDGTSVILLPTANLSRTRADEAAKAGCLTWAHILTEEFYEAMAEEDQGKLRTELIQVAAVATAWVEAIDRRRIHRIKRVQHEDRDR